MPIGTPVPQITNPITKDLLGSFGSFPLHLEASALSLVVLTMLAGIFTAAVSVILIYHWRRFPFEHEIFQTAERIYLLGTVAFLGIAVVGILLTP